MCARWQGAEGDPARWSGRVGAQVSRDARLAAASIDPGVGILAARAVAGVALDESNRSSASGSAATADELAQLAGETLDRMARRCAAPEVAAQAASLRSLARAYETVDASTVEGVEFRMRNQLEALGYVE